MTATKKADIDIQLPAKFLPLMCPMRYKIFYGGRAGAKSHSFARALLVHALSGKKKILCAREYQTSIKDSVKSLLDNLIEEYGLQASFTSVRDEIRADTGSRFIFKGFHHDPQGIKSMEGVDICWVEEADTMSQQFIDVLIPTIRKPRSEIWFSYNPQRDDDPVHKAFVLARKLPPSATVVKVGWEDNPYLSSVTREALEWDREHDPEKYRHVWGGETLKISDAVVFAGKFTVGETPEPPEGTVFYHGMDFGFHPDPSTVVRFWIDEASRTLYVDREAYGTRVEIHELPDFVAQVVEDHRWPITADSARPDTIAFLRRKGYNVKPAKKGSGSIEEGISWLKNYNIVVNPGCKNAAYEFRTYAYKTDPKSGEIYPVLVDKHNHVIDALRYASEQLRKPRSRVIIC